MSASNDTNATVRIDHLDKRFGPETAVEDFNLLVAQGEFVTLLGPSCCGKTTTLRCVAGLERPDGGDIRIGNDLVASYDQDIYLNPEDRRVIRFERDPQLLSWRNLFLALDGLLRGSAAAGGRFPGCRGADCRQCLLRGGT